MAFFKLRFPGRQSANTGADALSNTPAESVEVIRKRARHRLMGSVVLVLGAVVGLPLLFDSQPRPVAIDTPIVIPDRNQAAPLATPGHNTKSIQAKESPALATSVPEQPTVTPAKSAVANVAALDPHEEVVTKDTKTEAKAEAKVETKVETKPDAKLEAKTDTKSEAKPESKESAKAKALLDGKDAPKSSDAVRSVVQVGAFADAAKAKEARTKLEQAGLKTYTQEVETKEGKRIRVRVGPFATKEEADKAAEKIRKLNLPTSVLKL
ncbi:MAG: SPOR domain-containing protein [Betaproteobacteria bacterium]|jgi:DedD protein|nr:SPOR domain-containing protein [Betaproteobacteria bacterium]NDB44615.1 SPOR domain-containing protein [Betaproteobacteria bacterium]NDD25039.1 SPOR domain-containing protein [Betaproteobacteria bacterium]NDE25889.1 SPOR domain-containing protein [Betaproteobacteria bacterium]